MPFLLFVCCNKEPIYSIPYNRNLTELKIKRIEEKTFEKAIKIYTKSLKRKTRGKLKLQFQESKIAEMSFFSIFVETFSSFPCSYFH